MTEIGTLLSKLEDVFELLPFQGVVGDLGMLAEETQENLYDIIGYSDNPRYKPVSQEHGEEVISIFIGSAFVLSQTAITHAVSISKKISVLAGKPSWLPFNKRDILKTEANINQATGLSEMVIIDAVANYFKHNQEWPKDWNEQEATGMQRNTISVVKMLEFSPSDWNNLGIALKYLEINLTELDLLTYKIMDWRENLARHHRKSLSDHGL